MSAGLKIRREKPCDLIAQLNEEALTLNQVNCDGVGLGDQCIDALFYLLCKHLIKYFKIKLEV